MKAPLLQAAVTVLLIGLTTAAQAGNVEQDYKKVVPLLSAPRSVVGEAIVYPGGTAADITAAEVVIRPGEKTGWHKHGVPLFVYILSGEVTVDYGDKGVRTYKAGEAFMEAMDQFHNGMNAGAEPVRILAVYLGAEGMKNVIHKK